MRLSVGVRELSTLNFNARSMVNKIDLQEPTSWKFYPHVAVITETKLRGSETDGEIIPPSCKIYHRERPTLGGRIAAITRYGIQVTELISDP